MAKTLKSEIVDMIINTLEIRLKETGKHLLKTDTIFSMCQKAMDLTDASAEREALLEIGMRQVIQSRLYVHNYYSVEMGYFVNVIECENLGYLNLIIGGKDDVVKGKVAARNRLKELKALDGQMVLIPDENNILTPIETKTRDELLEDLEADAI